MKLIHKPDPGRLSAVRASSKASNILPGDCHFAFVRVFQKTGDVEKGRFTSADGPTNATSSPGSSTDLLPQNIETSSPCRYTRSTFVNLMTGSPYRRTYRVRGPPATPDRWKLGTIKEKKAYHQDFTDRPCRSEEINFRLKQVDPGDFESTVELSDIYRERDSKRTLHLPIIPTPLR